MNNLEEKSANGRSVEVLRTASAHVYYEIAMFNATAQTLMMDILGEGTARNAFLESFTIHTRALLQFLYPSGSVASDVLAEHFFDDPMVWKPVRGRVGGFIECRASCWDEIAHISYDRLNVGPEAKCGRSRTSGPDNETRPTVRIERAQRKAVFTVARIECRSELE